MQSEEDNLTSLPELNEENLLASIRKRFQQDRIYTDVGDILVAVNPFRMLPFYSESWSAAYASPEASKLMPHVYRVAARAFTAMVHSKRDQVCVISGESGAGKTESAKRIMEQASCSRCVLCSLIIVIYQLISNVLFVRIIPYHAVNGYVPISWIWEAATRQNHSGKILVSYILFVIHYYITMITEESYLLSCA